MSGFIPPTAYLLNCNGVVINQFRNLSGIAYHLGIRVFKDGRVEFMGKIMPITYRMDEWTKEEVVRDWSRCYMSSHLPSQYTIYRYLLGF